MSILGLPSNGKIGTDLALRLADILHHNALDTSFCTVEEADYPRRLPTSEQEKVLKKLGPMLAKEGPVVKVGNKT